MAYQRLWDIIMAIIGLVVSPTGKARGLKVPIACGGIPECWAKDLPHPRLPSHLRERNAKKARTSLGERVCVTLHRKKWYTEKN